MKAAIEARIARTWTSAFGAQEWFISATLAYSPLPTSCFGCSARSQVVV